MQSARAGAVIVMVGHVGFECLLVSILESFFEPRGPFWELLGVILGGLGVALGVLGRSWVVFFRLSSFKPAGFK